MAGKKILGQLVVLWDSLSIVRYTTMHGVLGVCNFTIAGVLFAFVGLNHHVATAIGHFLHVGVGFFVDRQVSFKSPETKLAPGMTKYWIIEALSYTTIVVTMYVMVDIWAMDPYFSRGVVAMLLASLVSYGLNSLWTFSTAHKKKTGRV